MDSLNVLIVDENTGRRRNIINNLGFTGMGMIDIKTVEARSGSEALVLIKLQPSFDIIVCYLKLVGEVDSIQLIRHFAEMQPAASMLLITELDHNLVGSMKELLKRHGLKLLGILSPYSASALFIELFSQFKKQGRYEACDKNLIDLQEQLPYGDIVRGIKRKEFVPWYQPKVNLKTKQIVGVESLMQWEHPGLGTILPEAFMPAVEHYALDGLLTEVTLSHAIPTYASFLDGGGLATYMAVHAPALFLHRSQCLKKLKALLEPYSLKPDAIILELSDTEFMNSSDRYLEILVRLRMNGFGLSLSISEKSYALFKKLCDIPFTELKVKKCLIKNMQHNKKTSQIIKSLLYLAKDLNVAVVAEGVDTRDDFELVKQLGFDIAQGAFIAEPINKHSLLNRRYSRLE